VEGCPWRAQRSCFGTARLSCFVISVTGVHPTSAGVMRSSPSASCPWVLTAEAAYKVLDASDALFDADNPAICPAGTEDSVPSIVTVAANIVATTGTLTMPIYGFRVTIAKRDLDLSYDADQDVYVPLPEYNNKVVRSYEAADISAIADNDSITIAGDAYTIDFASDLTAGTYKVEVNTVNMDGSESVSDTEIITV
jgi:hypothetical protein